MSITVVASIQNKLKEELAMVKHDLLPDEDPVFSQIRSSSFGVGAKDDIGRNFQVKHAFITSLAGAFKWVAETGDAMSETPNLYNAVTAVAANGYYPTQMVSPSRVFPTAGQATLPGIVHRTLTLTQGMGTIALPIHVLQADVLSASILKYVAVLIKQCARLTALTEALSFYETDGYGGICTMAATPTVGSGDYDGEISFTVDTGRIGRLYPGMLVNFLDATNSYAALGTYPGVVVYVDYANKTAVVKASVTDRTDLDGCDTGDVVVPWDSGGATFQGPSGLEDWIKDISATTVRQSTESIFGLPLSLYPQLGSMVAAVSDSLDESTLNKYFGGFDDAYGSWVKLDTILTTGGVTREFIDQAEDLGIFQRQGAALNLKGGFGEVGYVYDGRPIRWVTSRYCAAGTLYGVKLGENNIARYVPPAIPGTGREGAFPGEIQFAAPLGGASGIFLPDRNGDGAITEYLVAPYFCFQEKAPMLPQSIKLTSLTELNP